MVVIPMSYSADTVARRFKVLKTAVLKGVEYQVLFEEPLLFVVVIETALSMINGRPRHKIVATLELVRREHLEGVLVSDFWQEVDVAQIEGAVVDGQHRGIGMATLVYETVVNQAGLTLLSDHQHYGGGKRLWQSIARQSSELDVYILDSDMAKFYPYNGYRLCYDGVSIPESAIWSSHPDCSQHGVVLVAESRGKHQASA